MKPLRMETLTFKPLPPQFVGAACSKCDQLRSKWCIQVPNAEPLTVCSLCVMYEYPWGIRHREELDEFVSEVEKVRGTVLTKDDAGKLTEVKDADGVIGAIVLTSRLFNLRNKIEFDG